MLWTRPVLFFVLATLIVGLGAAPDRSSENGVLPSDKSGRPLNFDFETGDLRDWHADGEAFKNQPIEGDSVFARRKDMHSRHAGRFWVGTYERLEDRPHGTLTSVPFTLTKPFARFLISGGARNDTRFEIVQNDTKAVVYQTSGDDSEELKAVAADLSAHLGKVLFLRLVDHDSDGWGHINFDDFKLWSTKPTVPIRPSDLKADSFAHEGLPPETSAAAMTVPAGFKVTLFAGEPDVVQPIAFAIDDRGRLWVAEAYSYTVRVPEAKAQDRILIFEDTDNDGHFDTRKIFADKLNLVSGIEVGFGGVWVGAAPNFMFIPDRDRDDRPDGPPQILLDGWGYHDTHETLNSFTWGPDGWLYGCHGVFTHSRVGKPGTPDEQRIPVNAAIWRYHPTRHTFEVFANGTSNPWGVDFDANGQAFLTSCVIPHLYHVIQGARYERQAGPHFNLYTFEDIVTIADHRHYLGTTPHGGNGRSDQAGGGHAHAGALIYQGAAWPKDYVGSIFMNNIHGARLNRDTLEPKGSGYIGHHASDFLFANDRWSQIVSLKAGPDGQVYMIDWYDKNQCHRSEVAVHDRTNGRIFKVSYEKSATDSTPIEAKNVDNTKLITRLISDNQWQSSHARRLLQERSRDFTKTDRQRIGSALKDIAFSNRAGRVRLNALWTLHVTGELDQGSSLKALNDANPYLRGWAIQLALENTDRPAQSLLERFAELARSDASPVVRLYLASALQRLPLETRWPILEGLVTHSEDASDHNLPLMIWYGAEPLAVVDASRAVQLALNAKLPNLLSFMVRRISAVGSPEAISLLVETAGKTKRDDQLLAILSGLNEALKGRREVAMPAGWPKVFPALEASGDAEVRSMATALAITFGDPNARKAMRSLLQDMNGKTSLRREAMVALVKARDPELPDVLRRLLNEPPLRAQALRGLAAFDDSKTPAAILRIYTSLAPEERRDALNTLAARPTFSLDLLASVAANQVPSKDLSADIIRQLRNHKNATIDAQISKVWGSARDSTEDKARLIRRTKTAILTKSTQQPDVELGRAVFAKTCQQCHTLFGVGGKIGPELTGSNRADLDYLLSNVLDPSALIGKDYIAHTVATNDGRVLTGLIRAEDKDAVTLQTANELLVIPRGDIEQRRQSDQSMMPDDLWTPLSVHEVRSVVAYLASPGQVPMLATPENVASFFNGRDLTGWDGDSKLWSVENGEIVGKTPGLGHNEFLRSALSADNFRLSLQVKLVDDRGNSGVQFRSQSLPDGEMKGYQADIGPGWWGKLYEENGRALLWSKSGEAFVFKGEWNTYEIRAAGTSIRTKINGHECVVLDDPKGARRGIFAFQLHSGEATEVRFKDIKLEIDPKSTIEK